MRIVLIAAAVLGLAGGGYALLGGGPVDTDALVEQRIAEDPNFDPKNDGVRVKANVSAYHAENPALRAANEKARKTMRRFFELEAKKIDGTYTIKMPLEQNGETEHIWMQYEAVRNGAIHGRLANQPVNGNRYKMGDPVSVRLNDVEDWMVVTKDAIYGGYTTRVMLKDLPPEQAQLMEGKFRD